MPALDFPIGIGAGLYLAENRGTLIANAVRFLSDVLNGLPSIVMGIFAWQFLVKPMGKFTALAGGIALVLADRIVSTRAATWQSETEDGNPANRTMALGNLGGATLDNEENYLIKKLMTALGVVQVENQARI